jgi:hypothetical protein
MRSFPVFFGGVRVAHHFSFLLGFCLFCSMPCALYCLLSAALVLYSGLSSCCPIMYLLCIFMFLVPCCDIRNNFRLIIGGVPFVHPFSFLCCVVLYCCVLFVFVLYLVCPMLSVSLDCSFLIALSIFSIVYLIQSCRLCVW